jgi:hypothetical protein
MHPSSQTCPQIRATEEPGEATQKQA